MAYRIVSVFCLQYSYEQGIVVGDLSDSTSNQRTKHPTDSRKFRYHKLLTLPANTVSLTHCMPSTG